MPFFTDTEVNDINKQQFLAELGKLLTFMYEEDRQTALSMYGRMFDDTQDEQKLIRFLGSPTRQAVVIARAYNARSRRLQVEARSREGEGAVLREETPEFVLAIEALYRQIVPEQPGFSERNEQRAEALFDETAAASDETEDRVGAFLQDFSLPPENPGDVEPEEYEDYDAEDDYADEEPAERANIPLLILYILLGVPVTLLGVVLLLIPTLLFLALAAVTVTAGAAVLVAAFGGFKILADFLLLFGTALMLLALGLLFLWIFIWFIGGAIAGLVSGVIRLGRRWCYKEVAA